MSLSTSRSRGLSTGTSGSCRRRISAARPAARIGRYDVVALRALSTAFTSSLLVDSFGRKPAAPSCSALYTIADSSCADTSSTRVGSCVASDRGRDLGAVHAGHPVVEQRHLRLVGPDRLERTRPSSASATTSISAAGHQRAHDALAEHRVVVTHHDPHLFVRAHHRFSFAQRPASLPPIGGHRIHPSVNRPFGRHTAGPRLRQC